MELANPAPVKVTSCEQMMQLSIDKKAVWVKGWKKHIPAAFLISWQARLLIYWIKLGEFTVYEPTK